MSLVTLNNRALKDATAVGTTTGLGNLVFISRSTASSSSSLNITSGIDSTYKEYIFFFNNIHPAQDGTNGRLTFNLSIDGGSNYNVTKTTTASRAYHSESGSENSLSYFDDQDLAQATSDKFLTYYSGNQNDACNAGTLHLFDPSNTTFVKHFICVINENSREGGSSDPLIQKMFTAGYANTTSAINAVQFKMNSGNIDSGTIKMYGVV